MMKQPAENPNASEVEQREAMERSKPLPREPDYEEVAEVARELWANRGGGGGSPEQDWFEAEEIVRRRRAATTGLPSHAGNGASEITSHSAGKPAALPDLQADRKEHKYMDNRTGTMGQTGSSGMMSEAGGMADPYLDNELRNYPRSEHREGRVARSIEQQTAKIPSDAWLWAAVGSMGISLALELAGKERTANFVGHWVPSLLIFGIYNKLVKLQGSEGA